MTVALENNPFAQKAKGTEKPNLFIEQARRADAEVERLQEQFNVQIPDTPEAMLELLQTLSDDEIQELLKSSDELEQRLREFGPQDDDELHAWIKSELGINLPRTSVCPDHDAPFKFIADLYFERVGAVLAMGNRGGGKTLLVAILHWLNSLFKPGCESCTFGATEAQSLRCYAYIKGWIYVDGVKRPEVVSTLMRKTLFTNTSDVEVLPGTPDAVNGPHPQKAHADEVELMREDTWKESRNMRQPLDALIATPDGWRRMGDLKVGDYVFGLDGKQKRVLALHDISEQDIYRVELTDGRSTECCNEHLWMVCHQPKRSVRANFKVMQTQEMLKSGLKGTQGYRYGLPLVEPVQYDEQDLPVDPYVLGVLIGDGCLREQKLTFRSEDKDILREVERRLPETVRVMSDARNDGTITYRISKPTFESSRNPVMAEFDRMGLTGCGSHEKFVPDSYKRGDIHQRLDLLRGLMDTDGSFSKDPYFATVSERLAADVSEIVYSLGGRGLCRRKATSASARKLGSCGYIYEVSVSLPDEIPFLCQRKIEKFRSRTRTLGPAIRSITFVGRKLARCISVEDEMYLTDSYIPTHNTMGKTLPDGRFLRPQDICTSTRKGPNGRMQKLIDEITAAVNAGYQPPRTLYQWCIKETAQKMTNCRVANPDLPEDQKCNCNRIRKGDWEDGSPRLLEHICNGDFYRADGWQPFENIIKQFTENDQETFETQSLCLKPEMRFHYLPKFNEAKHCFRNYDPDPRNGPIYTSVDWGGTNPHAVNWYQYLKFEIEVDCFVQSVEGRVLKMRLPAGSIICFDEIYRAEIGNARLGQLVKLKESNYRRKWGPSWNVQERFADPQGKAARIDWKNIGLKTSWHITREFEEHIKVITDIFDDDAFYVAGDKCPMWVREGHEWRRHESTGLQIDTFNHCMSDFRYAVANIAKLHRRNENKATSAPVVQPLERQSGPTISIRRESAETGPVGFTSHQGDEFSRWRNSLGQPVRAGATFR